MRRNEETFEALLHDWGNKSELYFVSQVWQLSIFNYIFKHRITIIKIIAGEMKRNNFEEMKESRFPLLLSVSVCGYNPSVSSLDFLKPSMKWRCQRDRLYKSSIQEKSSSVSNSCCIIDSFSASLFSSMQFVFFKLPYLAWNMSFFKLPYLAWNMSPVIW